LFYDTINKKVKDYNDGKGIKDIKNKHTSVVGDPFQRFYEAFETEDIPILEMVHTQMGTTDFLGLNPVLMSNDIAPVKVRKALMKLITQEQQS
jgi:hypothetical protein